MLNGSAEWQDRAERNVEVGVLFHVHDHDHDGFANSTMETQKTAGWGVLMMENHFRDALMDGDDGAIGR